MTMNLQAAYNMHYPTYIQSFDEKPKVVPLEIRNRIFCSIGIGLTKELEGGQGPSKTFLRLFNQQKKNIYCSRYVPNELNKFSFFAFILHYLPFILLFFIVEIFYKNI